MTLPNADHFSLTQQTQNQKMKTTLLHRSSGRYIPIVALSLMLPSVPAFSQTTLPPDDELLTLPDFTVTASSKSEYMSAESTTGTRVASKIQDLPFAVNVVTSEFIEDFSALEFGDQFAYTSNVVGYETISTGYSVRGFEADVQLRNGFRRIGLIDKVSVDRAEVIKGPAASIYGTILPGGVVNIITKKPTTKPEHRFSFTGGSNSLLRAEVSSSGPVGQSNKVFYRVDLAADSREYDLPFKKKDQETGSAQLLFKLAPRTTLHLEVERLVREEYGNATIPFAIQTGVPDPYRVATQNRTYTRYTRLADELLGFNVQGPDNFSKRYVNTYTGTFEHQIRPNLSFRSSANWFDRNLVRQEVAGRDQYNPVTKRLSNSASWVPRYRPYGESGGGWQNDLLASFETGSVKHKLLVTLDYQRQEETPQRYDGTAASFPTGSTVLANGLDPANPDYRYISYEDNPSSYTLSQDESNSLDIFGLFISERASFMDGKLIALVGGRIDYVDNHSRDLRTNTQSKRKTDDFTYQLGLNYRLTQNLTAYANASTSFVPQFGVGRDETGATFDLPNEQGKGWEVGLKASLLENRLNFTAGYFDIERGNVALDVFDATVPPAGAVITVLSGRQASKGYELDFNYVISNEFQIFGGLGYTDSKITSHEQARHLIGTATRRTPDTTVGIGMKYDFKSGPLAGLYFTAGYKYNSESLINPSTGRNLTASASNPIVNNPLPNGLLPFPHLAQGAVVTSGSVRVDDGRESITNDPYHLVDAGVGYRWKTNRANHRVQLNLTNLFDEVYTFGSSGLGASQAFSVTYGLRF
jgi:iron complex outermembrane receptor protein